MKKNSALLAIAGALGLVGDGGGSPPTNHQFSRWTGAWWRGQVQRNYIRWPFSKYKKPHQGAQECIRRAIGGFAARRCNPSFTKQKMLDAIQRGHIVTYTDALEMKYGR